jgi:hypothetical protein
LDCGCAGLSLATLSEPFLVFRGVEKVLLEGCFVGEPRLVHGPVVRLGLNQLFELSGFSRKHRPLVSLDEGKLGVGDLIPGKSGNADGFVTLAILTIVS